jgi:hypothetical protein
MIVQMIFLQQRGHKTELSTFMSNLTPNLLFGNLVMYLRFLKQTWDQVRS